MRLLSVRADHAGGGAARQDPKPTRDQIVAHMDGNICRCGTYHRIIAAIESVGRA